MRLFTAITFEEEIKDSLCDIMNKLRLFTERGSFTLRDNLHLTLNFIGETDNHKLVEQAINDAVSNPNINAFDLSFAGFGRFKRRDGAICWIGVEKEDMLLRLQKELAVRLIDRGFNLEDQEYKPHLTLARRVRFNDNFKERDFEAYIPNLRQHIKKISLMKSEHIKGRLTYTEIFYAQLNSSSVI